MKKAETLDKGRSSTEFVELLKPTLVIGKVRHRRSSTEFVELFLQRHSPWRLSFVSLE